MDYAWQQIKRSWDDVQEDENGLIQSSINQISKKPCLERKPVQRGIIRHLCIICDLSESMMNEKDFHPSRLNLSLSLLQQFINEFFDQNPLSCLGLVASYGEMAYIISGMSSNPLDHSKALLEASKKGGGDFSLQNALETGISMFNYLPNQGTREVLILLSTLTFCDPGNIHLCIPKLKNQKVRVSAVSYGAEVSVMKKICLETRGSCSVAVSEQHVRELVMEHLPPPEMEVAKVLIQMGFPQRQTEALPVVCACHSKLQKSAFKCPQCSSFCCKVPSECPTCGLSLCLSPHLARSYHHLFDVKPFKNYDFGECTGCMEQKELQKCTLCLVGYCQECTLFIHDFLHNCPTC